MPTDDMWSGPPGDTFSCPQCRLAVDIFEYIADEVKGPWYCPNCQNEKLESSTEYNNRIAREMEAEDAN